MEFIWFLIVGALSGWLAGQFWKGSGFGLVGNLVVGILGGILGGWLAGKWAYWQWPYLPHSRFSWRGLGITLPH